MENKDEFEKLIDGIVENQKFHVDNLKKFVDAQNLTDEQKKELDKHISKADFQDLHNTVNQTVNDSLNRIKTMFK